MAKILNIVETAYRATIEEQDDTVLWLTHMLKNSGADITVMLRGNAVNYAAKGQDASGLCFGDNIISHPPKIDNDLAAMIAKGIPVFVVKDDLEDRGLSESELIPGIQIIARQLTPELLDRHDHIWQW
jgi:hypothetical protein